MLFAAYSKELELVLRVQFAYYGAGLDGEMRDQCRILHGEVVVEGGANGDAVRVGHDDATDSLM